MWTEGHLWQLAVVLYLSNSNQQPCLEPAGAMQSAVKAQRAFLKMEFYFPESTQICSQLVRDFAYSLIGSSRERACEMKRRRAELSSHHFTASLDISLLAMNIVFASSISNSFASGRSMGRYSYISEMWALYFFQVPSKTSQLTLRTVSISRRKSDNRYLSLENLCEEKENERVRLPHFCLDVDTVRWISCRDYIL